MEFYFSDANITKNRLMLEMVTASEFVPLESFRDFNRIKSLTSSVEDLKKALATSENLLVSEDGSGVRRKVPYDPDKVIIMTDNLWAINSFALTNFLNFLPAKV